MGEVIVNDTTTLLAAVADGSASTIVLGGTVPFRFNSTAPQTLYGRTALFVDGPGRTLTLRAEAGRQAVLDAGGSINEPRRVITVEMGTSLTLVNVNITGGFETDNSTDASGSTALGVKLGGGLLNFGVLKLQGCHVVGNRLEASEGPINVLGGGVANGGSMEALETSISFNEVFSNGGIAEGGGLSNMGSGSVFMKDVVVSRNTVHGGTAEGGGVFSFFAATTIERSNITFNSVRSSKLDVSGHSARGGGILSRHSTLTLDSTFVSHNQATGPVATGGGVANSQAQLTAKRCTVSDNLARAERLAQGGGISNHNGDLRVDESVISHNIAMSDQTVGGSHGFSVSSAGGGILNYIDSELGAFHVTRSNITSNNASAPGMGSWLSSGGGIWSSLPAEHDGFLESSLVAENNLHPATNLRRGDGGRQVFNGGGLVYVMPAPLGRYVSDSEYCPEVPVRCLFGECPVQPCNTTLQPFLSGRHLARLPSGPMDSNYPPACVQGSFATTDDIGDQRLPTCGGLCATDVDPRSTTRPDGGLALSHAACVCDAGFFLDLSATCTDCPSDSLVDCSGIGLTLETLPLRPGLWRPSARTQSIYVCNPRNSRSSAPEDPSTCRGSIGTGADASSDGDAYCYAGLKGPRCQVCVEDNHFLDTVARRCRPCPATGAEALVAPLLILLVCAGVLGLLRMLWVRRWRLSCGTLPVTIQHLALVASRIDVVAKTKIVLTQIQLVLVMPEAFNAPLPPIYFEYFVHAFQWLNLDWFAIIAEASCVASNYMQLLQLKAFGPIVLLAALNIGGAVAGIGTSVGGGEDFDGTIQNPMSTPLDSPLVHGGRSLAHARERAGRGIRQTLPLTLACLFALWPSVCARIFAVFSCEEFRYDDETRHSRWYMYADPSVECNGLEYESLTALAFGLMALWPVGVPVLFGGLLVASRTKVTRARPLLRAVSFLHAEYRHDRFYWELLEMLRRFLLAGLVFIFPQQSFRRFAFAIAVSIWHLVLVSIAAPYKQPSTHFVAVAGSVTTLLVIMVMLFLWTVGSFEAVENGLRTAHELRPHGSGYTWISPGILLAINFAVLVAGLGLLAFQLWLESVEGLSTLVVTATGRPPELYLAEGKRWHLFLSHNWANQDAVHTLKRQLQRLLPRVRVFLDVDDLESVDAIEEYVGASAVMLILLGSPAYFASRNCQREMRAAKAAGLPLVCVHETDLAKHGAPLSALRAACPTELVDFVFRSPLITWHRLKDFQLVALAQLAERLVQICGKGGDSDLPLSVSDGLAWTRLQFRRPIALFVSPNNPGAQSAYETLRSRFRQQLQSAKYSEAEAWLLHLSVGCFDGEMGARLTEEIEVAMADGMEPVMVFEPEQCGFEFQRIIESTPERLKSRGIYGRLVLEWRGESSGLQHVSVQQVAKALGAVRSAKQSSLKQLWSALASEMSSHGHTRRSSANDVSPRGWTLLDCVRNRRRDPLINATEGAEGRRQGPSSRRTSHGVPLVSAPLSIKPGRLSDPPNSMAEDAHDCI